jgi:hypothetical protein
MRLTGKLERNLGVLNGNEEFSPVEKRQKG